jgi:hypothetical protein
MQRVRGLKEVIYTARDNAMKEKNEWMSENVLKKKEQDRINCDKIGERCKEKRREANNSHRDRTSKEK